MRVSFVSAICSILLRQPIVFYSILLWQPKQVIKTVAKPNFLKKQRYNEVEKYSPLPVFSPCFQVFCGYLDGSICSDELA